MKRFPAMPLLLSSLAFTATLASASVLAAPATVTTPTAGPIAKWLPCNPHCCFADCGGSLISKDDQGF